MTEYYRTYFSFEIRLHLQRFEIFCFTLFPDFDLVNPIPIMKVTFEEFLKEEINYQKYPSLRLSQNSDPDNEVASFTFFFLY
jgi:hypothetical protein